MKRKRKEKSEFAIDIATVEKKNTDLKKEIDDVRTHLEVMSTVVRIGIDNCIGILFS
jgi:hypothetical protein